MSATLIRVKMEEVVLMVTTGSHAIVLKGGKESPVRKVFWWCHWYLTDNIIDVNDRILTLRRINHLHYTIPLYFPLCRYAPSSPLSQFEAYSIFMNFQLILN